VTAIGQTLENSLHTNSSSDHGDFIRRTYDEMRSSLLPPCFPGIMPKGGEAEVDDVSD
jgi:hypothetical protein